MYDFLIIGAGPSGLFTALELMKTDKKIAIIEAGVDLDKKICYVEQCGKCKYCRPTCNILGGYGGAQFFEGTKLSIYPAGSGFIDFADGIENAKKLYNDVDLILEKYGKRKREYVSQDKIDELKEKFKNANIDMKYYNAQKVSKITMNKIAKEIKKDLLSNGVDIFLETFVNDIAKDNEIFNISTNKGFFQANKIIMSVGRIGSRKLKDIADKLKIQYQNEEQEIEIGVRVEAPYNIFDRINNIHNDIKLKRKINNNEELRTFCQDYKGYITKCVYNMQGDRVVSSLDGHIIGTDEEGGSLSKVVNLAVHHRFKVEGNMDDIYEIISKINIKGKPIIQSLKNFFDNVNSKNVFHNPPSMPDVCEGNINDFLPQRTCSLLKDFIVDIDKVVPGFANGKNMIYAPSFEMGWKKFNINKNFETNVKGIYIIGDATGHFRGAMQAMASGILIAKRLNGENV